MGKISKIYTTDPDAPKVIEVPKLHVYEDAYGRRWYQTTTTWPEAPEIRYLGRYEAKLKKLEVKAPSLAPPPNSKKLVIVNPKPKTTKKKAKKKKGAKKSWKS